MFDSHLGFNWLLTTLYVAWTANLIKCIYGYSIQRFVVIYLSRPHEMWFLIIVLF